MPRGGVPWIPHDSILTFEEILKIVKIMANLGVRYIKVTGGEPLLRRGTAAFLKKLKNITGIESVTLTTNGVLLGEYLNQVSALGKDALPDGVNISLDALDRERYKQITRYENADMLKIVPVIDNLLEKKITVKINCVPVHSVNEEEILPITSLAKDKNIIVRFIELMPLGSASEFQFVSGKDAAKKIEKAFGILEKFDGIKGRGPAVYYNLPGFVGMVGFIDAVSRGFCETCNRLRLTSEGFLKLCLFSDLGLDLREQIRAGVSDEKLSCLITELAAKKPQVHSFLEKHPKGMSAIGG
jgi:cyclic pyranopterin phosphate synthase